MPTGSSGPSSHTLLVVWLQGVLVFAMSYGIAPEQLCARAGIPLDELTDRDRRVPRSWAVEVTRALKELLPDVALGFETGLFWSIDRIGYLGELVRHSSSLREAMEKGIRVLPIIDTSMGEEQPYLRRSETEVGLIVPYGAQEFWEEWVESLAVGTVAQLRAVSDVPVVPLRASFKYVREERRARYAKHFGCPIEFGSSENAVFFEAALLERPVKAAKPELAPHLERHVAQALQQLTASELIGRVQYELSRALGRGELSADNVARALGMGARSMQRKLEAAGTSYRTLADAARKQAALRLIDRPELAIYEMAMSLGYRDVSSFVQAFRRWTGHVPSAYRKQRVM